MPPYKDLVGQQYSFNPQILNFFQSQRSSSMPASPSTLFIYPFFWAGSSAGGRRYKSSSIQLASTSSVSLAITFSPTSSTSCTPLRSSYYISSSSSSKSMGQSLSPKPLLVEQSHPYQTPWAALWATNSSMEKSSSPSSQSLSLRKLQLDIA